MLFFKICDACIMIVFFLIIKIKNEFTQKKKQLSWWIDI